MRETSDFDFLKFRTKNTDTIDFKGKDYILFDEPMSFVSFFIPNKIYGAGYINKTNCIGLKEYRIDQRYYFMMQQAVNFIYLNPEAKQKDVYKLLTILNCKCVNPVNDVFLGDMLKELVKLKADNKIEPTKNLERFYLINPKISKENTKKVMGVANGELKRRRTLNRLKLILTNWGLEKYSNYKLATRASLTLKTIELYTPILRDEITKIKKREPKPKENKSLSKLKKIMVKWNLDKGLPTYADLATESGLSLDTIKSYGKYLKPIKQDLKKKQKNRFKKYNFFAPFDGEVDSTVSDIKKIQPTSRTA
ncbi:hypothetical protein [Cellulophaga sp. Asnod2-G02]|uniref:hypothetical protein n=1 Tax=Cellulophaga sp. Asnod2-G02 TaxID=3160572 RepID=UPI0038656187